MASSTITYFFICWILLTTSSISTFDRYNSWYLCHCSFSTPEAAHRKYCCFRRILLNRWLDWSCMVFWFSMIFRCCMIVNRLCVVINRFGVVFDWGGVVIGLCMVLWFGVILWFGLILRFIGGMIIRFHWISVIFRFGSILWFRRIININWFCMIFRNFMRFTFISDSSDPAWDLCRCIQWSNTSIIIWWTSIIYYLWRLVLYRLFSNTNLQIWLILIIMRSHIIHDVVLLHKDGSYRPQALVANHRSEYGHKALVLIRSKVITTNKQLSLSNIKQFSIVSIINLKLKWNINVRDHTASLVEFADVFIIFTSNIMIYLLEPLWYHVPVLIWDVNIWQVWIKINNSVRSWFKFIVTEVEICGP